MEAMRSTVVVLPHSDLTEVRFKRGVWRKARKAWACVFQRAMAWGPPHGRMTRRMKRSATWCRTSAPLTGSGQGSMEESLTPPSLGWRLSRRRRRERLKDWRHLRFLIFDFRFAMGEPRMVRERLKGGG